MLAGEQLRSMFNHGYVQGQGWKGAEKKMSEQQVDRQVGMGQELLSNCEVPVPMPSSHVKAGVGVCVPALDGKMETETGDSPDTGALAEQGTWQRTDLAYWLSTTTEMLEEE